jgi:hypothetical protein
VNHVGAGIGIADPPIARMPLDELAASNGSQPPVTPPTSTTAGRDDDFEPLTIPRAKVRLTSVVRWAGATANANSAPASTPLGGQRFDP